MREHDFEPIRGLPGDLPEGESILWQGAPSWLKLAEEAFHVRAVAGYFAVMLVWRAGAAIVGGAAPLPAIQAAAMVAPIALLAVGILAFLAWLNSRSTVYTITNRRVVMRFGAAIPKAFNLPFAVIEGAAIKPLAHGAGDIALTLKAPNKIAFLHLWPHVRPWRMSAPEPTLRAIPDAQGVAKLLADAMQAQVPIEITQAAGSERPHAPSPGLGRPETVPA